MSHSTTILDKTLTSNPEADGTDLKLAESICLGDSEAFTALFRKYYESMYRFASRFVRDPQTAENIVQDVFVNIWTNRRRWKVRSNVKAYLFASARNRSLNHLKHEKRMSWTDYSTAGAVSDDVRTPEDELIDQELVYAVQRAMDKLPEQCRQIYQMRRYDELSYLEIAEIKGISVNTVKTQLSRALKSLERTLAQWLTILIRIVLNI